MFSLPLTFPIYPGALPCYSKLVFRGYYSVPGTQYGGFSMGWREIPSLALLSCALSFGWQ